MVTSSYEQHVEELMDLRDAVLACRQAVLRSWETGVAAGSSERPVYEAFAPVLLQCAQAVAGAERLAASARLVRTLFYSGITERFARTVREVNRDLAALEGASQ
jgi:hypothetical protein